MNQLARVEAPRPIRGNRVGALAAAILLLTGCGGADDTGSSTDTGLVITIDEMAYEVPESVPAGATITVRNDDAVAHTVTSDEESLFDVFVEGGGNEITFTAPEEPGSYDFYCIPHPTMTDVLVVE